MLNTTYYHLCQLLMADAVQDQLTSLQHRQMQFWQQLSDFFVKNRNWCTSIMVQLYKSLIRQIRLVYPGLETRY